MKRILVVDDDGGTRDAYRLALTGLDYAVEAVDGGPAGIAAARRQTPDLIFLDLNMPGMDGVETLRALLTENPSLRVYIQSAFVPEYMARLKQATAAGLHFEIVRKPLDFGQIRTVVTSLLDPLRNTRPDPEALLTLRPFLTDQTLVFVTILLPTLPEIGKQ
jgi:CheY-like chemotaxis protein